MSPEFLLTALIVVFAPGTGVIYTLATGLSLGSRAATARDRFLSSPRAMTGMRRSFAAAFAGLGLKLAFERA